MARERMAARDFLESLLPNVSDDGRAEAMERAYDAMEAADAHDWELAMQIASESLQLDPFNPWALMVVNDASIGRDVGADDEAWATPHVQARRLPGLVAAFTAGQAVAFEKQAAMLPPLGDVWNMHEARPYVRAALALVDALEVTGQSDMADALKSRLRAQGVWQVQSPADE